MIKILQTLVNLLNRPSLLSHSDSSTLSYYSQAEAQVRAATAMDTELKGQQAVGLVGLPAAPQQQ